MLFSALRCFLVELYSGLFDDQLDSGALRKLGSGTNDIAVLREHASLPTDLLAELTLLYEVRHEIIHPAHRPGPERDNAPAYLSGLKARGLLHSTGRADDYIWIAQLQSHRLFHWGFVTIQRTVLALLDEHPTNAFTQWGLRTSYSAFSAHDASPADTGDETGSRSGI